MKQLQSFETYSKWKFVFIFQHAENSWKQNKISVFWYENQIPKVCPQTSVEELLTALNNSSVHLNYACKYQLPHECLLKN